MKRLYIVKFHPQLGPQLIIQFPPDKDIPDKEVFLRIWAHYEMNTDILFIEIESDKKYLSIPRNLNLGLYFIILEIDTNEKYSAYHDILLKNANTIFNSLESPKLNLIVNDIYNIIKEYTRLSFEQLLFNIFEDIDKLNILEILRNGVIDKKTLVKLLKEKYGKSESSIDTLINPFYHINLIVEEDLPGIKNCIFLIYDVACFRFPPKTIIQKLNKSTNKSEITFINENREFFRNYRLESTDSLNKIAKIMSNANVYNIFKDLLDHPIKKEVFLAGIEHNLNLFEIMKNIKLIIEISDQIYPMAEVKFIKFVPIYLLKHLKTRYERKEISTDEFLRHTELIKNAMQTGGK